MRFILRMARREFRSSWRRLLFFFVSIGIGVAAIVAVRSLIQNVNLGVAGEARELITADAQVSSNRPWTKQELADIDSISRPLIDARTETLEVATMLRPADPANDGLQFVEMKAIGPGFPLYGDFKLANGSRFDYHLLENHGVIVAPSLLDRLKLKVGDSVNIGKSSFQIRGIIGEEPGPGGGFRLGPRVFAAATALDATGLTGFGSRVRRKILFKTKNGTVAALVKQLRDKLKGDQIDVTSYRESEENISESLTRTENYLSLVGLIILVLGGVGISNVTRVFVEQRKKSIAVLKCLGARSGRITAIYLFQVVTLGLAGSILGVVVAKAALASLSRLLASSLPKSVSYSLRGSAVVQGIGIGILISLLFSALPLLRIRRIKP
ncbi:MAG TPA: FtsX-like permease family protein, partial [Blastocatellia bacterium]|nr:FtsX-like permease family protein [Blastocatellia bacterium]